MSKVEQFFERPGVVRVCRVLALLCFIMAIQSIAGCALLKDQVTQSAEATADAVVFYCDNFTQDQRTEYGDQVRALADPHSIRVECEGDQ